MALVELVDRPDVGRHEGEEAQRARRAQPRRSRREHRRRSRPRAGLLPRLRSATARATTPSACRASAPAICRLPAIAIADAERARAHRPRAHARRAARRSARGDASRDALEPFLDMKADAARDGIDIAITSGFRDFAAQQRIWDMKYRGERPLYDADGQRARSRGALAPRSSSKRSSAGARCPARAATTGAPSSMSSTARRCPKAIACSSCPGKRRPAASFTRCTAGWTRTWRATASSGRTARSAAACCPSRGT